MANELIQIMADRITAKMDAEILGSILPQGPVIYTPNPMDHQADALRFMSIGMDFGKPGSDHTAISFWGLGRDPFKLPLINNKPGKRSSNMRTYKYKAGDKVVIIKTYNSFIKGMICEVRTTINNDFIGLVVDGKDHHSAIPIDQIEPYAGIKVGDTVRSLRDYGSDFTKGKSYKVGGVRERFDGFIIMVVKDDKGSITNGQHSNYFELVPNGKKDKPAPKYPKNAITRVQALKLAKQLHPEATHIMMNSFGHWILFKNLTDVNSDARVNCDACYDKITVPIKYSGDWKDSCYPKVKFSKTIAIEGFQSVTLKPDGTLKVGCTEVSADSMKQIIEFYQKETAPKSKVAKKPAPKKAAKKAVKNKVAKKRGPSRPKKALPPVPVKSKKAK